MSDAPAPLLSREAKVGLFALISVAILFWGTFYIGKLEGWLQPGNTYSVIVTSAHELGVGSAVEVAGVRVGQVRDVELRDGGQTAKVRIVVDDEVLLYEDAFVQVLTVGFLGDRYISIDPGTPTLARIEPGGTLRRSSVAMTVDEFMEDVAPTLENLRVVTEQIRTILEDPRVVDGIPEMLDSLHSTAGRLDRMVARYEQTVGDLVNNAAETARILRERLPTMADAATQAIERVDRVGESIEATADDIREIIAGIERGEGTVGALLKDETTATEVKQVVSSLNDTLGRVTRLQTIVEYLGMYHTKDRTGADGYNNTFSLKLQPAFDRYYSFGVVYRGDGDRSERTRTVETLDDQGNVVTSNTERVVTDRNKLLFNLLFAKRFHDATFRAGVIENTAGLGMDYAFWKDRIWLRAEGYDFARSNDRPRLRSWGELRLFNHLRLAVGVEDAISNDGPQAAFGAGIYFTDQDLKLLFGAAPGVSF